MQAGKGVTEAKVQPETKGREAVKAVERKEKCHEGQAPKPAGGTVRGRRGGAKPTSAAQHNPQPSRECAARTSPSTTARGWKRGRARR